MAKKVLFLALLFLSFAWSTPSTFAEDTTTSDSSSSSENTSSCPDSSNTTDCDRHFSVFDVLNVNDSSGSTALPGEIKAKAEAEGGPGSVVAALILRVINILLLTIGTLAFITFLYAGFLMVTANGDESKLDRAKGIFTQTLLGMVFTFLAYFIVTFVQSFFY